MFILSGSTLTIIARDAVSDVVYVQGYGNGRYSVFYGADDTPLGLLYVGIKSVYISNHLVGSDGNDFMVGAGSRGDRIVGGDGDDLIYGRAGHDVLYGGAGSNELYGGEGTDTIYGGAGSDVIDGGSGVDMSYAASFDGVTVNLATGRGSGGFAAGDVISNIENIIAADNRISGGSGDDRLQGGAGDDTYLFSALIDIAEIPA